jgi:hypothetical protein
MHLLHIKTTASTDIVYLFQAGTASPHATELTFTDKMNKNIYLGTLAFVCASMLVVMMAILCLSKAYRSFLQRLFMYLVGTSILAV